MRAIPILLAALTLGGAGGYAWSMLASAPAERAQPRRAKMIAIAPSPEELPEAADREWTALANDSAPADSGAQASDGAQANGAAQSLD
jgi:hypothetical protein